jgi:hypothetical protein
MKQAIAIAAVLALTTTALAEELVLHAEDSITIDGQRYTCADRSRRGVQMQPGDKLTAGKWRLKCKGDDDSGGGAGDAATTTIRSNVETACIQGLNNAISGRLPAGDAARWADACRTVDVGRACTVTSEQPDSECYSRLDSVISGHFSQTDAPAVERACKRIEASCRAGKTAVTQNVDIGCLDQLYRNTSGKPTGATVLSWIESCRGRQNGRCVAVNGSYNGECVQKAYNMISGKFSPSDAAAAARACRTVELRCE